ncbi:MAG TPA: tRNA glutamyl-Q(34) synthetase GluQRS [Candidatus Limnocylindria bacterium]|nr:tRNA glutamyl-Q(34) synthetase GluQRS [Candidatus Limnocylindria bacterium]
MNERTPHSQGRPDTVPPYRGRLAPSPTGLMHLGHARTFWIAHERARAANGTLVLRNEDLDRDRARPEFVTAFLEDLRWFGCEWQEGPKVGGPFGPYSQSERLPLYADAFERLRAGGFLFPCTCSRKDILASLSAPHVGEEEPVYPGNCRDANYEVRITDDELAAKGAALSSSTPQNVKTSWRFRVTDGETVSFIDGHFGPQHFVAGRDFGDFIVWRHDGLPSYQLACTVDDAAMGITEVVRGADLLLSTARQLLLYRALGLAAPEFFHCPLMTDEHGVRLAKRHDSLSLRALRERGETPEALRAGWATKSPLT